MRELCQKEGAENPGLNLGATLGQLTRSGRDKVTIVVDPEIGSFGLWLEQLLAERRKLVPALCLLVLMTFMWVRVIFDKKPHSATARARDSQQQDEAVESEIEISLVELVSIKGRNDVLSRDFFAVNDERLGGIQQVSGQGGLLGQVAAKLKLQAIGGGDNPQAFINNKLLNVGDKLSISHASSLYECEVVRIEENMVVVKCREAEIKLILAPEIEVVD